MHDMHSIPAEMHVAQSLQAGANRTIPISTKHSIALAAAGMSLHHKHVCDRHHCKSLCRHVQTAATLSQLSLAIVNPTA